MKDSLKLILDNCYNIRLNCNDFFYWGCADSIEIDWFGDGDKLIEVVDKFGIDGLNAFCSFIRKCEPQKIFITEKFKKALEHLKDYKLFDEDFYKEQT